MSKYPEPTSLPRERAFLIGVDIQTEPSLLSLDDSLSELHQLCKTAGLDVVGETTQRLSRPNVSTYIGTGKVSEVKLLVEETRADIMLFDNELSPRHQRELEKILGDSVRVLDRTALILDIFAQHANTREGILQVELAQYEYRLPRLTRAWTHLARQAGGASGRTGNAGGVGLRGPGETQLEVDRREIRNRITRLKKDLEKVRNHRMRHRVQRQRLKIPVASLVGYTNAGKSTLLNNLSKADIFTADMLFATLDPTTRRVFLPGGENVLFTDTVGFIQKLPTQLVAAFRATLEEIAESDLLVHLVDITHPNALAHWESVQNTLADIAADHIPMITALNKVDLLPDPNFAKEISEYFENAIPISAITGEGINTLLQEIEKNLFRKFIPLDVFLPYQEGGLISLFHSQGNVEKVEHKRNGVQLQGKIPGRLMARFQLFLNQEEK
ncbi:MAG: GTPase HflX [Anaerolineaceae bacterium]|nr:GTPase HflX [Anaerolineaceae bacterium]